MKMKNCVKHFAKICNHKRWVFHYCRKAGIPIQGLKHDMSKFSPVEFWEGVKYYQGDSSPIDACKRDKGVSMAWLHHKGRNKHHYEYWQDNFDNGGESLLMPYKYAVEMVCDYLGAGRAYMGKDFTYQNEYVWWQTKKDKPIAMHPDIKNFVDQVLKNLAAAQTKEEEKAIFKGLHLYYLVYTAKERRNSI